MCKTPQNTPKCLKYAFERLKVSCTVLKVETSISKPRRLPCTTPSVGGEDGPRPGQHLAIRPLRGLARQETAPVEVVLQEAQQLATRQSIEEGGYPFSALYDVSDHFLVLDTIQGVQNTFCQKVFCTLQGR